ncbi:MAG: hypothetical protein V7K21_20555 [Nostoc sp.]|uniref:hypothetical protein n=1 Tax=Nostoc sp. TaxID=1180 RepID=UPI002FF9FAC7
MINLVYKTRAKDKIKLVRWRWQETTSWCEITTNPPAEFIHQEEFIQPSVVDIDR